MKTTQQRPPVGVMGGSRNLSSLGAPPATSRRTRAEGPSFRAVMPKLGRAPSGCGGVGVRLGGGSHSELRVGHWVPQQTRAGVFESALT